ncbi:GNAT domain-containing protein [Leptodontidium sp. 2 PMI_412]|nr:GNAT domain-containing protein [Leptodontidium sp. MPI-SDFR-AT-0119]KAH9224621.1 GNAT domain-containing protein [Leptodontidium sp. 2 PMI_412]
MTKNAAQSERLWLQPMNVEDHLEGYHALVTDELVTKWSSDSGPRSLDRTKEKLISRMPSDEKPWMEMYAILLRPSGAEPATFIGAMGIIRLSEDEEAAEVGYGILPDHRGKGYAPEALKLLADYYWTSERKLQKEKLHAGTEPENLPSQRVLEKAGFTNKGILEKAFEAPNQQTGEMEWRSVIIWEVERPKA